MTSPVVAPPALVVPTITSGPSARLQLDDPATLLGIFMALFAAAAKAVPAIAGIRVEPLYPAAALLAASIVLGVILYSKHKVQAALVTVAVPALALVREIAPHLAEQVAPLLAPLIVDWRAMAGTSTSAGPSVVIMGKTTISPPPAEAGPGAAPPESAQPVAADPTVLPPTVIPPLTPPVA